MLYFNGNAVRPGCVGLRFLFPCLFVDCLVESRRRPRFPWLALRRWVVLRMLKAIHRVFFLFYETGAIL